jgi:hypothetical protein
VNCDVKYNGVKEEDLWYGNEDFEVSCGISLMSVQRMQKEDKQWT